MARKRKPVALDFDGDYKTDGMYRSGRPTDEYSPAELQQRAREVIDDFNLPAMDRVKSFRSWLSKVIAPHIDGPHDPQSVLSGEGFGWIENLLLSTGAGVYRINAERHTWVEDCVDALRENCQLEQLLIVAGDVNSIVRLSVRQGQLMQRIQDRAIFAPFALIGKRKSSKSYEQANRTNKKRAERRPDYNAAVQTLMDMQKLRYTPACKDVAKQFNVTVETVRNNTPQLWPRRKRK